MLCQVLPERQCDESTGVRGMTGPAGTAPSGSTAGGFGCRLEVGLRGGAGLAKVEFDDPGCGTMAEPIGAGPVETPAPELFTAGWRLSLACRFSRAVCTWRIEWSQPCGLPE